MGKMVSMEKLKELFAKHFSEELRGIGGKESDFLTVMDYGKAVQSKNIDDEKALALVCNGKYTKAQVVHIRLSKDLSNGWALTVDSLWVKKKMGASDVPASRVPYENYDVETTLLDTTLKAVFPVDGGKIEVTDVETFSGLATRQALVAFLQEVKELVK